MTVVTPNKADVFSVGTTPPSTSGLSSTNSGGSVTTGQIFGMFFTASAPVLSSIKLTSNTSGTGTQAVRACIFDALGRVAWLSNELIVQGNSGGDNAFAGPLPNLVTGDIYFLSVWIGTATGGGVQFKIQTPTSLTNLLFTITYSSTLSPGNINYGSGVNSGEIFQLFIQYSSVVPYNVETYPFLLGKQTSYKADVFNTREAFRALIPLLTLVYTDSGIALLTLSGNSSEAKRYTDAQIIPLSLTGAFSESRVATDSQIALLSLLGSSIELNEHFDARTALLTLLGSSVDSKQNTDSGSGSLSITGSSVEALNFTDSDIVQLTLTGSATDIHDHTGTGIVELDLFGTSVDSAQYVDSRIASLTLSGVSTEAKEYIDNQIGQLTLNGTAEDAITFIQSAICILLLSGTSQEHLVSVLELWYAQVIMERNWEAFAGDKNWISKLNSKDWEMFAEDRNWHVKLNPKDWDTDV